LPGDEENLQEKLRYGIKVHLGSRHLKHKLKQKGQMDLGQMDLGQMDLGQMDLGQMALTFSKLIIWME